MRLADGLHVLGGNRGYLILGLAGLVLVGGTSADYVSPVAEKAAEWVLPEVEASRPAPDTNGNGNGGGWFPAPTTMGWSGTEVPVEPDADFAVLSEADVRPKAPEAPATNGHG